MRGGPLGSYTTKHQHASVSIGTSRADTGFAVYVPLKLFGILAAEILTVSLKLLLKSEYTAFVRVPLEESCAARTGRRLSRHWLEGRRASFVRDTLAPERRTIPVVH